MNNPVEESDYSALISRLVSILSLKLKEERDEIHKQFKNYAHIFQTAPICGESFYDSMGHSSAAFIKLGIDANLINLMNPNELEVVIQTAIYQLNLTSM